MIRTSITPQQADILIPPQYIGKKLEVMLYAVEEEITEKDPKPATMTQF